MDMGIFSKPKKEEPKPDPIEELEKELVNKFRDAENGGWCRTVSYEQDARHVLGQEWREAHKVGPGKWIVVKKQERDPGFRQTIHTEYSNNIVDQDGIRGGQIVSFYEAVKALAEYEASQESLGFKQVQDSTKQKLGDDHYKLFAEREGLVFDVENKPHPTVMGRVVSRGRFPAGAFNDATKAIEDAQQQKRNQTNSILGGALAKEFDFNSSAHLFTDYTAVMKVKSSMSTLNEILLMGVINGFVTENRNEDGMRIHWQLDNGETHMGDIGRIVNEKIGYMRRVATTYSLNQNANMPRYGRTLSHYMHQAIDVADFYAHFVMTRRTMYDMITSGSNVSERRFHDYLQQTETRLRKLGATTGDLAKMRSALMQKEDVLLSCPDGLEGVKDQFEKIAQAIRDNKPVMTYIDTDPKLLTAMKTLEEKKEEPVAVQEDKTEDKKATVKKDEAEPVENSAPVSQKKKGGKGPEPKAL